MYHHKIVNTITGEETIVPLDKAEIAILEANTLAAEQELAEAKAAAEARATQKAALLDRLGITEAEAKLLLA
jgi:hypothetical protein